jgi:hypothetical protein
MMMEEGEEQKEQEEQNPESRSCHIDPPRCDWLIMRSFFVAWPHAGLGLG